MLRRGFWPGVLGWCLEAEGGYKGSGVAGLGVWSLGFGWRVGDTILDTSDLQRDQRVRQVDLHGFLHSSCYAFSRDLLAPTGRKQLISSPRRPNLTEPLPPSPLPYPPPGHGAHSRSRHLRPPFRHHHREQRLRIPRLQPPQRHHLPPRLIHRLQPRHLHPCHHRRRSLLHGPRCRSPLLLHQVEAAGPPVPQ